MFKIVISEPKSRRAWQIEKDVPTLIGLKIGDRIDGSLLGLTGFTLEITGGSDKDGFPMRVDLQGVARKKVLLAAGPGYRPLKKGIQRRKYIRGNTISEAIVQVNCKVVSGEGDIAKILGISPKEKEEPEKVEKEKLKKEEEKPKENGE